MTLRVLMTADTVGGVWTYALDLCRGLTEQGVEVELAAMGPEITADQRRDAQSVDGVNLHFFAGRLEWMDDPWADVDASCRWVRALSEDARVDLLHANTFCHAEVAPSLPTLAVGHSCVPSWFMAVEQRPAPAQFDLYRGRVRRALQAADLVGAPTRAMLDALTEHYGTFARSAAVPNGRCFDGFAVGEKRPFLLGAGRLWDRGKNAAAIVEAAPRWSWPVHLAGATVSPDGRQGALESVHLLGPLEPAQMARWMSEASIFVAPARYEPFGLAPFEAAASGCALVLGDIPSLREVWGCDAVFVSPDRPAELQQAVQALIDDPGRRRKLGQAARARALELDHRTMAAAYLDLYRRLLATERGVAQSSVLA